MVPGQFFPKTMGIELCSKKDPMTKYCFIFSINSLTFGHFLKIWSKFGQIPPERQENHEKSSVFSLVHLWNQFEMTFHRAKAPGMDPRMVWVSRNSFFDNIELQNLQICLIFDEFRLKLD